MSQEQATRAVTLWRCPVHGLTEDIYEQRQDGRLIGRWCNRECALDVEGPLEYVPASRLQEALRKASDPIAAAEAHNATLCLRTLVGQGTDTWDPLCVLPAGHAGACKSVTALREDEMP